MENYIAAQHINGVDENFMYFLSIVGDFIDDDILWCLNTAF